METYLVPMWVVECGVQRDGCISMVKAADAQATVEALQAQLEAAERHNTILQDANKVALEKVEALQAEKLMLERGVSAQSALIDDLQSQLIQRTAALEAVQHERDEANSHVKFLGATKQANGSFCLDMKKYHARYRCGRHRDDPWKGIDTEIDCFVCLKHDLDAEREKVAERNEFIADCDMTLDRIQAPRTNDGQEELVSTWRRIELIGGLLQQYRVQLEEYVRTQSQLSQLQALVRALPIVTGKLEVDCGACYYVRALDGKENPVVCGLMTEQATAFAIKALLAYRATLDAMTPAKGQELEDK